MSKQDLGDSIAEIRARHIACTEWYPVHIPCGGECTSGVDSRLFCHACGKHVDPESVCRDFEPEARVLKDDVRELLARITEIEKRAESYSEALRELASYVGSGGYNAPDPIDARVFVAKVRDGIDANDQFKTAQRAHQAEKRVADLHALLRVDATTAHNPVPGLLRALHEAEEERDRLKIRCAAQRKELKRLSREVPQRPKADAWEEL